MINKVAIKTFNLEDLIDRTIKIRSFKDKNLELIVAIDKITGDLFVLKEINHPDVIG